MKKIILFICLVATLLISCNIKHNRKLKVDCYKQHITKDDGTEDMLFWYIIMCNNGGCYSYSSSNPVTNFSNAPSGTGLLNR